MKRTVIITLIILTLLLAGCDLLLPPADQAPTAGPSETPSLPTAPAVILPTPTGVGTPSVDQLPQAIFHDCPFETETIKIECGSLFVFEDHANPGSKVIEIAFLRYKSQLQVPAPDPVLYLGSEIGFPSIGNIESFWQEFPLLYNRDIILFDPRGSGQSLPSLNCTEINEDSSASSPEAISSCFNRLTAEGIDLNNYHSAAAARDAVDLIHELGYGKANLLGSDYGSRLALTILRDFPESVRSVVLDSPVPINVNIYNERPLYFFDVFDTLMSAFLDNEENYDAFGEFESYYYELIRNAEFEPIFFDYPNSEGIDQEVVLGSGDLAFSLQSMLSTTGMVPIIPAYFNLIYNGNPAAAFDLRAEFESSIPPASISSPGPLAEGLRFSVLCSEEAGFNDSETASSMIEIQPKELKDYLLLELDEIQTICSSWGVQQADSRENLSFTASVPILILSGEYDTISPTAWGRRLIVDFPNSFYYEFPQMGHTLLENRACAWPLIEEFVNFPNSQPSNTCVERLDTEPFYLP